MLDRLKTYNVYLDKNQDNPLEGIRLSHQGFSFFAFLFSWMWALFNKLWLFFLVIVLIQFLLNGLYLASPDISFLKMGLITFFLNLWIGFEASNFKNKKITSKGYTLIDIVTGYSELDARRRFYDNLARLQNKKKSRKTFSKGVPSAEKKTSPEKAKLDEVLSS